MVQFQEEKSNELLKKEKKRKIEKKKMTQSQKHLRKKQTKVKNEKYISFVVDVMKTKIKMRSNCWKYEPLLEKGGLF